MGVQKSRKSIRYTKFSLKKSKKTPKIIMTHNIKKFSNNDSKFFELNNTKMIIGIEPIMVAYETTVLPLNYIVFCIY